MSSLLAVRPDDDPALRHARARALREARSSQQLDTPVRHPDAEEELRDEAAPLYEPRRRLRDLLFGRTARATENDAADARAQSLAQDVREGAEVDRTEQVETEAVVPASRKHGAARTVIGLTLSGAVVGAGLAMAWPKAYVARSEMLIDPQAAQSGSAGSALSSEAAFALVDNQLRVLRSGTMLNAAVERLNLTADPEFNGEATGPFGLGGTIAGLGDLVAGDGASVMERRRRHAVDTLDKAVQANRVGGSSVIAVTASTGDPQKSALVANTISELFLANAGNAAGSAGEMTSRLADLRAGVEEAERAIEAYKAQNGLVDAQGRLITDDEIVRLGERVSAAQARTVELNARAASTRDANVDSIVTGSLPEEYASPTLTELRARYADAKQQADRSAVKLGPRHPELLAAQAELEGARQEIAGELRRVASALQTELTRAVRQEQELASQLAQMKERQGDIGGEMVALRELQREADARRSVYEQSLRAAQTGGQASAAGGASLISRAEPPLQATGPSLAGFSVAGGLAGLLAGLGLAGWRRARERDGVEETALESAQTVSARETETYDPRIAPDDLRDAQEVKDMNAYPPYYYPPAQPHQPAADHAAPAQAPNLYPQQQMQGHPAHAQPVPPMPAGGWPAVPHPAAWHPQAPMMPAPGWHASYHPMPPQYYAPPPYAPPAQHYYGAPPAYPAHPAAHAPQQPAYAPPPPAARHAAEEAFDQDAYIDDSTDAAIQEIRQSLREFRDAIEDFADSRPARRRYGT